ncbi:MAG: TIGR04255 family protein [Nostoc sp.]|uniref:TIGR04255 family protein n=1 Tax=Nostoc sp. TaxID=1180 RepID=UPI002FF0F266
MKFPESPRVRYTYNPLVEVICQLRFPKILRIEKEAPVDFQEAVRLEYPVFNTSQSIDLSLLSSPQPNSPPVILGQSFAYEFADKTGEWKLTLGSDFIALSTPKYESWEDFRKRLLSAVEVLTKCYNPSHFTRIGLRYENLIIRSELGLENRPWRELFNPPVLGVFVTENLSQEDFTETFLYFRCRLDYEDATVNVRCGLGIKNTPNATNEPGYFIDADFNAEKTTEIKDATTYLDQFNREAGNLFQWCITPTLHQSLQPKSIER